MSQSNSNDVDKHAMATDSGSTLQTSANGLDHNVNDQQFALAFGAHEYTATDVRKFQSADKFITNIKTKLSKNSRTAMKNFTIKDDLVFKLNDGNKRLILPSKIAMEWLTFIHVVFGHCGEHKLRTLSKKDVYIYGLDRLCNDIIRSCADCIRVKPRPKHQPVQQMQRYFEHVPFEKIHIDLWDAGRKDRRGKKIFSWNCRFSDWLY